MKPLRKIILALVCIALIGSGIADLVSSCTSDNVEVVSNA